MDVGRASRRGTYRRRVSRSKDRKVFSRTANRTRKENSNLNFGPMRGGIRL